MKKNVLSLLFLFLSLALSAQKGIFFWTDTSTAYINHRIVNIIQNGNSLYALSKSQDAEFQNPHPSFSRITLQGKVQNFSVYPSVADLYDLNAQVMQPDGKIRIYGTTLSNNKFSPFINSVTPEGEMANTTFVMVSVPHFTGDAKQISKDECVWVKSIRGSATNIYNAFVYRINMANNDMQTWRCPIKSDFNEESSKLIVLPDTSVLLLCKRYADETFLSWTSVIYKIDPKGQLLWTKELGDFTDFESHSICSNGGSIYYTNCQGNEKTGISASNIVELDQNGELIRRIPLDNINATGAIVLSNGKLLVYGGRYTMSGRLFIKKARVMLFDNKLTLIKEREMGALDRPDSELPGLGASQNPTSSDFLCGVQLADKRIAIGGRVYMPLHHQGTMDMILSQKANRNLLILCDENGEW